jgi:hypothetical protein
MAPRITHAKVSSRPAGNDPGRIYGPDWNNDHVIQGLTIGADVQAHNAQLDGLSALTTTPGLVAETAANTFGIVAITGTINQIDVANGSGAAGNPTISIDPAYVGQASITTVGTIASGTWQGTVVTEVYGGTHQSSYTLGDLLYASAGNTLSRLAGNTASTRKFLRQTGTGSVSAAPAWDTLVNADIAGAGAAFTKTDDTNVTATLGGSASTAVVNAMSLTMGWTGTLSGARGGTGVNNGASTITVGGNLATAGAASLPAIAQGDVWYGSAAGVKSALAKSTSATRYLANTGASNNPNWDQVNLANGVTGTVAVANGGTAQASAAAARGSSGLNVESFTGHGDSNYAILATDKVVGTNAAFSASRTWTLPAASAVNAGQPLVVADFQGTVTGTNTLVVTRAGSDTVNGGTSITINSANGAYIFWSDGSSKWTAQAFGAAAGVTSIGGVSGVVGLGNGLATSGSNIALSASTATNSLSSDVNLTNTSTFFDGPSCGQGTAGTWYASGTVTIASSSSADTIIAKLWDGNTVIASAVINAVANNFTAISLSGILASPSGNIKISVRDNSSTSGVMRFNASGAGRDSTLTCVRIA